MIVIKTNNLSKQFRVYEKPAGLIGSLKSLFNNKFKTRRIIVTRDGETVIRESLEHYRSVKIGKKIVYFILMVKIKVI